MRILEMLGSHPLGPPRNIDPWVNALGALHDCSFTCHACADACLLEDGVDNLRRCIRYNLDCAAVCETTAGVLTRCHAEDGDFARTMLEACAIACRRCGADCAHHASRHEHCRICAAACDACAKACDQLIEVLLVPTSTEPPARP